MCPWMASRILRSVSSNDSPVVIQPGRSGTYADQLLLACSKTTAYVMLFLLFVAGWLYRLGGGGGGGGSGASVSPGRGAPPPPPVGAGVPPAPPPPLPVVRPSRFQM